MFSDANSVPAGTVVETEVCIIGAGAAGITLAREFIGARWRVAVLESGGIEIDGDTQDLYDGSNVGRPFLDLTTCRLRFFGGTTNHWGGWCLPLDPIDFEARDGLPYRGWPLSRADLDPWYSRAQEICQLGPYDYAPDHWGIALDAVPEPFRGPDFVCRVLQQSPPTRFGAVYEPELRRAERVTVYLNANVLRFETNEPRNGVQQVHVVTLSGNSFSVRAKLFVLAAGGIENARLLLASDNGDNYGLGNSRDLVGRFFMTHLEYSGGLIALTDPNANFDFDTGTDGAVSNRFGEARQYVSFVGLSEDCMRGRGLPNIKLRWSYHVSDANNALNASKRLLDGEDVTGGGVLADLRGIVHDIEGTPKYEQRQAFLREGVPPDALLLRLTSEQLPNPDSRVRLGTERDAIGMRKIMVDWNLLAEDKLKAAATLRLLGAEVGRVGFGRLRSFLSDDETSWPDDMFGDQHHMGTTRMHRDPTQGVVNEDCRVHGVANLYVAGSSVFPTCGAANPTLTITALALRLADHLRGHLA